ncbi:MAG: peptidoglycan DD-metalloendopeptidase family protein, partial [Deltaproteobacteria bacterium]|nr:peptidoglycan DD-metalloendopeptidase family protein [Deltaproteobacteria bacterium]
AAGIILVPQFSDVYGAQSGEIGIVVVNKLNFRREPGIKTPPLTYIKKGTTVKIIEHHDGWLKIVYKDQVGYVRNLKNYVRIISSGNRGEKRIKENYTGNFESYENKAERINRKIEKEKAEVLESARKEASIVNSLNDIDLAIDKARKSVSSLKDELSALEGETAETRITFKDHKKIIKTSEDYASERLVALYKLNWLGRIYVLASAQSMYDLFQRKKAMEQILAYDENIRHSLLDSKIRLQKLLNRLEIQKTEKLSVQTALRKQISMRSRERSKRSKLLDDIRKKRSLKSGPTGARRDVSSKSFSSLKGLLNMPVKGKIVAFFGPHKNKEFKTVNFQSGIEIKADVGEPIRAVYDGQILYASWFKGYGNMIIIDHKNNYYTVYAHAQDLFASKGDTVGMGEVVATVGDSGSMIGPSLHFEVRYHGKPLDPLEWIKKS